MSRLSDALATVVKHRDIKLDGLLYLRRFYLTPRSWPVRVFLHRIYLSDVDRVLHDHPWDFVTFILRGAYREELGPGDRFSFAPCVRINPAEWTHRVEVIKPCWTLVFAWRARREWGFYTPEGWVTWYRYYGISPDKTFQEDRHGGRETLGQRIAGRVFAWLRRWAG